MLARTPVLVVLLFAPVPRADAQALTYRFSGPVCDIGGSPRAPYDTVQLGDLVVVELALREVSPSTSPCLAQYDDAALSSSGSVAGISFPTGGTDGFVFVQDDCVSGPLCTDALLFSSVVNGAGFGHTLSFLRSGQTGCSTALDSTDIPFPVPLAGFSGPCSSQTQRAVGNCVFFGAASFNFEFEITSSTGLLEYLESCDGDGGNQAGCTDCPCSNNAPVGTRGGCLNSVGTSARLFPLGSPSISAADLRFEAGGLPPMTSGVLTSGDAILPVSATNVCTGTNGGLPTFAFDGLRCLTNGILRHGTRPSDLAGDIGRTTNGWGSPNGFFNFDAFTSGQTRHFQMIYRDDPQAVCMRGQNTTQAITVNFAP